MMEKGNRDHGCIGMEKGPESYHLIESKAINQFVSRMMRIIITNLPQRNGLMYNVSYWKDPNRLIINNTWFLARGQRKENRQTKHENHI